LRHEYLALFFQSEIFLGGSSMLWFWRRRRRRRDRSLAITFEYRFHFDAAQEVCCFLYLNLYMEESVQNFSMDIKIKWDYGKPPAFLHNCSPHLYRS
jgi:hypothetical protein